MVSWFHMVSIMFCDSFCHSDWKRRPCEILAAPRERRPKPMPCGLCLAPTREPKPQSRERKGRKERKEPKERKEDDEKDKNENGIREY